MTQTARIAGPVEFRAGDGPKLPIRKGPVEVQIAGREAVLSWAEGPTHGVASLPLNEFQRYVRMGAIRLQGETVP